MGDHHFLLVCPSLELIQSSFNQMPQPSAISVFIAATSLLVASANVSVVQAQNDGGLKEWNTDQGVDEESVLDSDAAALKKKAEQEDICVPIGEGENCW